MKLTSKTFRMKKYSLIALFGIGILSCETKKDADFTDQVISLVIANPTGNTVELPDLYNEVVRSIPDDASEQLILADRLKLRGFAEKSRNRGTLPLGGIRFVTVKLSKENCQCEVTKTYHSTAFVSEYVASERIKCY